MADEESWGQLLCTTETKSPIGLAKESVTIGRRSDCDISFTTNKLLSGNHCQITREEDGKTWLSDTSTNGTFLNGRKIKKGEKVQINHNDQIHLVFRKSQPDENIAYIFQDLQKLREEFNLLDTTQEYNADVTGTPELTDEVDSQDEMQPENKKPKLAVESECKQQETSDNKPCPCDSMGESLVCGICQDIFHDCLSLQPCMHSFCCACYSQWMDHSDECPTCRMTVKQMSRNHLLNNVVEAYLSQNPGKRRPAEEIAEMNARNKITAEMLQSKKKKARRYEEEYLEDSDSDESEETDSTGEDDDDDDEDYDDGSNTFGQDVAFGASSFRSLFGFTPTVSSPLRRACRWCPNFRRPATAPDGVAQERTSGADNSTGATTQATDGNTTSAVAQPVCPDRMVHLMCMCCMQPMPRQEELPRPHTGFTYAKSQKCAICDNFYCHLLWKCNKPGCCGCLNEFKDLVFGEDLLNNLILNNNYESQVLKNYLNDKGWSCKELLEKCLEKLDRKEYTTPDCVTRPELDSKFILCFCCGLRNFKELAYQFRRDIPRGDLPAAVTSRPDCHWGKNCRTQINPAKAAHASRFNHICQQTRFA